MPELPTPYVLRRAASEDEAFLLRLFVCAQETYSLAGGEDAQLRQLLALQFRARNASYAARYPQAECQLICTPERTPVGRLLVCPGDETLHLIDIALLPAYRARGIGTCVLRDLQGACAQRGLAITLSALREGRAQALYRRLGFLVTSEDAVYAQLEWRAPTRGEAPLPANRSDTYTV